jgi:1,4-alpha-glucan branching enzyme
VAAGLLIYLLIPGGGDNGFEAAVPAATAIAPPESVYVKFVLYAPAASQVALAGTFNRWDPGTTPLARVGGEGVWTVTVALPVGQHQYAFVVDGRRWVVDPAAPAVDDGFGRRNSIMSVNPSSRQAL